MENFLYSLKISAIGIGVVFSALLLVEWILNLLTYLTRPSAAPAAPEKSKSEPGIPMEVVVAISAAVSVALGKARIHHIRYRTATAEPSWSRQGRATIMASHVIKH